MHKDGQQSTFLKYVIAQEEQKSAYNFLDYLFHHPYEQQSHELLKNKTRKNPPFNAELIRDKGGFWISGRINLTNLNDMASLPEALLFIL